MAVSTIANGKGSVIESGSSLPSKGGVPSGPAAMMNSRLTPFPSITKPSTMRVRVRSRNRYTPQAIRTPAVSSRARLTCIGFRLLLLIDLGAQGAQEVEHHADHDQVDAEIEEQGTGKCSSPSSGTCRTGVALAKTVPPNSNGSTPAVTAMTIPEPSTKPAWTGAASDSS